VATLPVTSLWSTQPSNSAFYPAWDGKMGISFWAE